MTKFMNLEESLHLKSFIRIEIIQTFGKDKWFTWTIFTNCNCLLHMILDSTQGTHSIRSHFLVFEKYSLFNPFTQLAFKLSYWSFLLYFTPFILWFLCFPHIPRDVDSQSFWVISSHSGQSAKILSGDFSICATEKNTSKISQAEVAPRIFLRGWWWLNWQPEQF